MSEFNMYFPQSPKQERRRDSFATASPARTSPGTDRYIPNRQSSNLDDGFSLMDRPQSASSTDKSEQENNEAMNNLIMSELLGYSQKTVQSRHSEGSSVITSPPSVFSYKQRTSPVIDRSPNPSPLHGLSAATAAPRRQSEPVKPTRKIKRLPYKILDAPALQDDFYLNLVDWSYKNMLAVGLGSSVYLWAASTAKIEQLCNLGESDTVSSVAWLYEGTHLAVGTNLGRTLIYDISTKKMLTELAPHSARVGSLAWCGFSSSNVMSGFSPQAPASSESTPSSLNGMPNNFGSAFINNNNNPVGTGSCSGLLASGSRDKHIFLHDPRIRSFYKSSPDPVIVSTPRSASFGSGSSGSGSGKTVLAGQLRQQAGSVPLFPSLHLPDDEFDLDMGQYSPMFGEAFGDVPDRSMSTPIDDAMDVEMYSSPSRSRHHGRDDGRQEDNEDQDGLDAVLMSVDDFAVDEMEAKPPSFPRSASPAPAQSAFGGDPFEIFSFLEDNEFGMSEGRHSAPADSSRSQRMREESPFSTPSRSSYPIASEGSGSRSRRLKTQSVYARYPSFTPSRGPGTPSSRHSSPSASPSWAASARPGLASPAAAGRAGSRSGSFSSSTAPPSPPPTVPQQPGVVSVLSQHRQEVCGLKWSFDGSYLASGGNDNKLCVWAPMHSSGSRPVHHFADHTAAVKAIAWSPHQQHILASGGGTADRHIRFWNTSTGQALQKVDTGSQVCNLVWSTNVPEIVSTHGYSLNQIVVWKYPSMQKLATLTGHTYRVLYLALSPDGQTIVTGAGDETLRFWNVFPSTKVVSVLLPGGDIIR